MGGVSWDDHNKLKEENDLHIKERNDLREENEKLKKLNEERQKRYKEEEEKKERERKEKENKKNEALANKKNEIDSEQKEELKKLDQEIKNNSKFWCLEEIKEIDFEKIIKDCYQQLFQNENTKEIIKDNARYLIKELIKEKEINHLNIEIIGKTGVGKSTLINAIFRENLAMEKKEEHALWKLVAIQMKNIIF